MSKEIRDTAYNIISKRKLWGTLALVFLVYLLIMGTLNAYKPTRVNGFGFAISFSLSIAGLLLAGPFNYGIADISLRVINYEETKIEHLFGGFNDFARCFIAQLINAIFIFLWSLLLIIPGIIKAISYSMTFLILRDNSSFTQKEARDESIRIMEGHKMDYFCFVLSFIGWYLLSIITFGILFLWVLPYFYTAKAVFYEKLKGKIQNNNSNSSYNKINADELFNN